VRVMTERNRLALETKGTEFYAGTARLIATKEPPSGTNQLSHRHFSLVHEYSHLNPTVAAAL